MKGLENKEWDFSDLPNNDLTREVILQDIKQQESLNALEVSNFRWLEEVVTDLREDTIKVAQISDSDGWIDHWVHLFI